MTTLLAIVSNLGGIFDLVNAIQNFEANRKNSATLKQHLSQLTAAINAKDPAQLNQLYNS